MVLSQNGTVFGNVNPFCKLLKTLVFISQKSLDTPVFWLIRFRQKVLTESKPPLELFSLEEKAAQLPGGLFVFVSIFKTRTRTLYARFIGELLQFLLVLR